MPVYFIAEAKARDSRRYEQYRDLVAPMMARYGGRYLARGGLARCFGPWTPERIVIHEFPSAAQVEERPHRPSINRSPRFESRGRIRGRSSSRASPRASRKLWFALRVPSWLVVEALVPVPTQRTEQLPALTALTMALKVLGWRPSSLREVHLRRKYAHTPGPSPRRSRVRASIGGPCQAGR